MQGLPLTILSIFCIFSTINARLTPCDLIILCIFSTQMQDLPLMIFINFKPVFDKNARPLWFYQIFAYFSKNVGLTPFDFINCSPIFNKNARLIPCDFIKFSPIFNQNAMLTPYDFINFSLMFNKNARLTPCDFINFSPIFNQNARLTPCDFIKFLPIFIKIARLIPYIFIKFNPNFDKNARLTPYNFINFSPIFNQNARLTPYDFISFFYLFSTKMQGLALVFLSKCNCHTYPFWCNQKFQRKMLDLPPCYYFNKSAMILNIFCLFSTTIIMILSNFFLFWKKKCKGYPLWLHQTLALLGQKMQGFPLTMLSIFRLL